MPTIKILFVFLKIQNPYLGSGSPIHIFCPPLMAVIQGNSPRRTLKRGSRGENGVGDRDQVRAAIVAGGGDEEDTRVRSQDSVVILLLASLEGDLIMGSPPGDEFCHQVAR